MVSNIAAVDPEFKSVVDNRLKPFNLSDDFGNLAPSVTAAKAEESLASLYDEAMDIKNGYGKIGEKLGNELVRTARGNSSRRCQCPCWRTRLVE